MHLSTLSEWLTWINSVHLSEIKLGLDRVKKVAARLKVLSPTCPIIIVGGTNGKGSTVAGLEAIYRRTGYHVGAFTTPILFKHNEQVRIDGALATDEAFCEAFARIERAREDISLTPFEFHTLAALLIFQKQSLDVLILEVGLGGRLDAVNIIDADVAIITSIGIDHVEWLGETREEIAYEKAGIFCKDKPAICGEIHPPASLYAYAKHIQAKLFCQTQDFSYQENKTSWSWSCQALHQEYLNLPLSSLATQNMSTVLMAITLLQHQLPVTREAIDEGLVTVSLPGRIQVMKGLITKIVDVAHNPASVAFLAEKLKSINDHQPRRNNEHGRKTYAVFSMLADKDITESIRLIHQEIDEWFIAPLKTKRAATQDQLLNAFQKIQIRDVVLCASIEEAYQKAIFKCQPGDRIIIFGSFHTVAEILPLLS